MPEYKVGDIVVHWIYGSGTIVAIDEKGVQGRSCFYYVIEGDEQTIWVPVEENGSSSLHLPTSRSNFKGLTDILRSQSERMSNYPHQRSNQLDKRMQKASPEDLCLVIRDLSHRSHSHTLNNNDIRVMKRAQSLLLDEWERSLGTPRKAAKNELEWILKETQVSQNLRL